jgi:hypothetical protein
MRHTFLSDVITMVLTFGAGLAVGVPLAVAATLSLQNRRDKNK